MKAADDFFPSAVNGFGDDGEDFFGTGDLDGRRRNQKYNTAP
jgi:hypothetical protein